MISQAEQVQVIQSVCRSKSDPLLPLRLSVADQNLLATFENVTVQRALLHMLHRYCVLLQAMVIDPFFHVWQ